MATINGFHAGLFYRYSGLTNEFFTKGELYKIESSYVSDHSNEYYFKIKDKTKESCSWSLQYCMLHFEEKAIFPINYTRITVIGKRWFKKSNLTTYHSVAIEVYDTYNKKPLLMLYVPFESGFGSHFQVTAFKALSEYFQMPENLTEYDLYRLPEFSALFDLIIEVSDVKRKKDL